MIRFQAVQVEVRRVPGLLPTYRCRRACAGLALFACLVKGELSPIDILWTFSIFLVRWPSCRSICAAEIPGSGKFNRTLRLPGAYRGLYILNWVYRSYYEQFYRHNWLVYVSGRCRRRSTSTFSVTTSSRYYGGKLTLPTCAIPPLLACYHQS